jgi:hypothetical protein
VSPVLECVTQLRECLVSAVITTAGGVVAELSTTLMGNLASWTLRF